MMKVSKTTLLLLASLALAVLLGSMAVSADPGNEDWTSATEVFDGEDSQHSVAAGGGGNPADEDWYKIVLNEGQVLQIGLIFTDPQSGWVFVYVFGPDGIDHQVYWADQTQVNAQEVDMFVFANGTYYIRVFISNGQSSPYAWLVRVTTPPVLTSGNPVSNPDPLMGGVISSMWYKIWLKGDNDTVEQCEVTMTWNDPTDTHLYAYDRKCRQALGILNYSVSRAMDHSEDLRFAASYTGYYYLRAISTTLWSGNPPPETTFSIRATILGTKHKSDGNAVMADADFIPIRQLYYGKINQAYDTHDWFRFYLNRGEVFSAKATITDSHMAEWWDFFNITVYSTNGTILIGGHNRGTTGAPISACSVTLGNAPYSGTYYMSFSGWYSLSGAGTTDYTNGKQVNTCRYEMDILIPNRRVWIVDPPGEKRLDEDTELTIDLTSIFWDPEGDPLVYGTTGGSANFTLILSQTQGTLTIRPNENWYGTDKITIWAHDGRPEQKNSTVVNIVVKSVADPPFVRKTAPLTVYIYEDEVNTTALMLNDVFGDVDIEDAFLVFSNDQNEKINIEIEQTSSRVTLYGAPNYNGQQELTFYAADTYNFRVSHSIKIVVRPVNDAPNAIGKVPRQTTEEGQKSHLDVGQYFEDIDGDPLYYYAEWDQEGKIAFDNLDSNPLNSWFDIYPENPDFYGFVQVVFIVYDRDPLDPEFDNERYEARQSAIWEVKNRNDAPRIDAWMPDFDPTINELEEQTFTIASIFDVDSTTFRYKWYVDDVEQVEWSGSSFTFTTNYDSSGSYRIRCEVKDNLGEPANVMPEWTLTVANTNREPTVNLRTPPDTTVSEGSKITLQADGYDQDADSLTYTWYEVLPSGQEREIGLGANFPMKRPLPAGTYRFKCQVDDGIDQVWSEEVQVTVTAKEFPKVLPGFGAFAAFAAFAVAVATAVSMVASRRR